MIYHREPTEIELERINNLNTVRKPFTANDLIVFKINICDNEIDDDFEVFSTQALYQLKDLFLGKSGNINCSTGRIFDTFVIADAHPTKRGENHLILKALCYAVKTPETEDTILQDLNESASKISIGCSYSTSICSICGREHCNHVPGEQYYNTLCYKRLHNINEAYEWSCIGKQTDNPEKCGYSIHLETSEHDNIVIPIKYHKEDLVRLQKIKQGDWIDLRAAENVTLWEGDYRVISLGISMKLPDGYEAHVVPRSSTFQHWGILQTNSMGVIDNSYSGTNDIWGFPAYATRKTEIHKNDRICQFRIVPKQPRAVFQETDTLDDQDRGGFGSTGTN